MPSCRLVVWHIVNCATTAVEVAEGEEAWVGDYALSVHSFSPLPTHLSISAAVQWFHQLCCWPKLSGDRCVVRSIWGVPLWPRQFVWDGSVTEIWLSLKMVARDTAVASPAMCLMHSLWSRRWSYGSKTPESWQQNVLIFVCGFCRCVGEQSPPVLFVKVHFCRDSVAEFY